MLKTLRTHIINTLWEEYQRTSLDMQIIHAALKKEKIHNLILDHFAIIDLPGKNSGIKTLQKIFTMLGFSTRGCDYLPEKQNDFLWLAENDCNNVAAEKVLPQVVVADFRMEVLPLHIQKIINKYAKYVKPFPVSEINQANLDDETSLKNVRQLIINFLMRRDWPVPTLKEYRTVEEYNELLAWVLVFGRKPNHFTLSVHLMQKFEHLTDFFHFIEKETTLSLNHRGGQIKGSAQHGLEQGATAGIVSKVQLADGDILITDGFVEFIWRYPQNSQKQPPLLWQDYYTGFIAAHADKIIESLLINSFQPS